MLPQEQLNKAVEMQVVQGSAAVTEQQNKEKGGVLTLKQNPGKDSKAAVAAVNNNNIAPPTKVDPKDQNAKNKKVKQPGFIESLWRALIRPPSRIIYTPTQLGPLNFMVDGKVIARREDFKVTNSRGMQLECSYFEALAVTGKPHPCVLYLHGNSSSRNEGIVLIQYLIPFGISLVLMDFAGCGVSEGEFISLGYYEQIDAKLVIQHVKSWKPITEFGLWGRSMGAATTLMAALKQDSDIRYLVVDSSFTSIKNLCTEIAENSYHVPSILFSAVYSYIRKRVQNLAEFNMDDCDALKAVIQASNNVVNNKIKNSSLANPNSSSSNNSSSSAGSWSHPSALFLVALNDTLIAPSHSLKLYTAFRGEKRLLQFEGTHNSRRPRDINLEITKYFFNGLFDDYAMRHFKPFKMVPALPNFQKTAAGNQTNNIVNTNQTKPNNVPDNMFANIIGGTKPQVAQVSMMSPSNQVRLNFDLNGNNKSNQTTNVQSQQDQNGVRKSPLDIGRQLHATIGVQIMSKASQERDEIQPEDEDDDMEENTNKKKNKEDKDDQGNYNDQMTQNDHVASRPKFSSIPAPGKTADASVKLDSESQIPQLSHRFTLGQYEAYPVVAHTNGVMNNQNNVIANENQTKQQNQMVFHLNEQPNTNSSINNKLPMDHQVIQISNDDDAVKTHKDFEKRRQSEGIFYENPFKGNITEPAQQRPKASNSDFDLTRCQQNPTTVVGVAGDFKNEIIQFSKQGLVMTNNLFKENKEQFNESEILSHKNTKPPLHFQHANPMNLTLGAGSNNNNNNNNNSVESEESKNNQSHNGNTNNILNKNNIFNLNNHNNRMVLSELNNNNTNNNNNGTNNRVDLDKLDSEESKAISVNIAGGNYASSQYPPNLNTEGGFEVNSPRQPKSLNPSSVMNNGSIMIVNTANKEIKGDDETQFNSKFDKNDLETNNAQFALSGFFIPPDPSMIINSNHTQHIQSNHQLPGNLRQSSQQREPGTTNSAAAILEGQGQGQVQPPPSYRLTSIEGIDELRAIHNNYNISNNNVNRIQPFQLSRQQEEQQQQQQLLQQQQQPQQSQIGSGSNQIVQVASSSSHPSKFSIKHNTLQNIQETNNNIDRQIGNQQ